MSEIPLHAHKPPGSGALLLVAGLLLLVDVILRSDTKWQRTVDLAKATADREAMFIISEC
jgi:hypothetical protein